MIKDFRNFELNFPGHRIEGLSKEKSFETRSILSNIKTFFEESVVACLLLKPLNIEDIKEQDNYKKVLDRIYAKSFILALNTINELITQLKPPKSVKPFCKSYEKEFGYLKNMRNSIAHFENSCRGLDKQKQKIKTSVIVCGCFLYNGDMIRYQFTGDDAKNYEIEITRKTLEKVRKILQSIIDNFPWEEGLTLSLKLKN